MKWLSTHCNPLFWLPVFLLFFCFSGKALSFIPAGTEWFSSNNFGSSPSALCSAAGYAYVKTGFYQTVAGAPFISGSRTALSYVGAEYGWCGSYAGGTNGPQVFQYETCPYPGDTQVVNGHLQCAGDPPVNCPSSGTNSGKSYSISYLGDKSSEPTPTLCSSNPDGSSSNCSASCNNAVKTYHPDLGITDIFCGSVSYSGASCGSPSGVADGGLGNNTVAPVNNPPKSISDCPAGSGFASINNVNVCLAGGTKYDGGTTTTTSSSGSTTTTTDQTTVNKDGTTTTTRTTTTKDASGNVTGIDVTVMSGSVNQADGKGTDNKPIDLGAPPDFDSSLPNDSNFNIKSVSNPIFSTTLFGTSGSCPAPLTFEVFGRSFSIPFQPVCDLADIIRGIVLLLSAIVALRAVVSK